MRGAGGGCVGNEMEMKGNSEGNERGVKGNEKGNSCGNARKLTDLTLLFLARQPATERIALGLAIMYTATSPPQKPLTT